MSQPFRLEPPPSDGGTADAVGWGALLLTRVGEPAAGIETARAALRQNAFSPEAIWSLLEALALGGAWDDLPAATAQARTLMGLRPVLEPLADRADGQLAAARGDLAAAERLLRDASDGFERLRVPHELARTDELFAAVLPASRGRPLLEAAARIYERLGAGPSLARVRGLASAGT